MTIRGNDRRLEAALAGAPRERLAHLPTPLHQLPRLARSTGHDHRILVKRDDLTGLGLGGNKIRMFEYVLAHVRESGFDTVLAGAEFPSNYCHQIAAACARLGLRCHLVLGKPDGRVEGDGRELLIPLVPRLAASVDIVDPGWRTVGRGMQQAAERLASEGATVFHAVRPHADGLDLVDAPRYALGYAAMMFELREQLAVDAVVADEIWLCSTGPTQAGLVLANAALGSPVRVVGVSSGAVIGQVHSDPAGDIAAIATAAADLVGLDLAIARDDVRNVSGDCVGNYGRLTEPAREAIWTAARLEGLLVDPDYTGKALAALLARLREDDEPRTVIFVHTGGIPSLFSFASQL